MELKKELIENSFGTYIRGKKDSLDVLPGIGNLIDSYKKILQKFYAIRFEKIRNIRGNELYISVKIDGEYVGYYFDKEREISIFCNTPTHRIYMGLPVNDDIDKIMNINGIKSALLVGELYATPHDPFNFEGRSRVPDIVYYTRHPESLEDIERI